MKKRSLHTPKGMMKDLSASKLGKEYYIDALNIRIAPNESNTGFSITNIRSNALVHKFADSYYIGHVVLNNNLIVFLKAYDYSKLEYVDLIIKIDHERIGYAYNVEGIGVLHDGYTLLAEGDFNFDIEYPIEGIGIYEKEDVQKVYWIDGRNLPRYLNIARKDVVTDENELNFVKKLDFEEDITIQRNETTIGSIQAGVLQYVFTYYNVYGAETNIFYTSPLYYITYNNRGASPEDTRVSTSFSITVEELDKTYEYLRIYSIHRSSIDATPEVRRVADLLTSSGNIAFVDDGTLGETVDPTLLLYVGGKSIIPNTMEQKDNTLFMGNYEEPNSLVCKDSDDREDVKERSRKLLISFSETKQLEGAKFRGFYDYENLLKNSSNDITFYKFGETYRFGYLAQKATGEWSEPIFITDAENTTPVQMTDNTWEIYKNSYCFTPSSDNGFKVALPTTTLPKELVEKLQAEGYVRVRPMVVYPELTDRTCICLGVLCPTVFNAQDRMNNAPYALSSWFFRPNAPIDLDEAINSTKEDDSTDSSSEVSGITYENSLYYEVVTSSRGISDSTLAACNGAYMKFTLYPANSHDDTMSFYLPIKGYILSGDFIGWYVDSSLASSLLKTYLEAVSNGTYALNTLDYPAYVVSITTWQSNSSSGSDSSDDSDSDTDTDDITTEEDEFIYDYNTFYNLKAFDAEGTYTADHLNNWVIYTVEEDDMCPNVDKTVLLVSAYNFSKVYKTGYMERVTLNEDGYTSAGLKVVWSDGINLSDGDLKSSDYTLIFPSATWGDSNYAKWLEDETSVKKSECHVNPQMKLTFLIKNSKETEEWGKVEFDFNDPTNLNPSITPSSKDGGSVSIYDKEFTSTEGATMHINDKSGDNLLYTKIESGETSYYLSVTAGSRLILHSLEGVYARRISIVDVDTGEEKVLSESSANAVLLYNCITIENDININKVIYYYEESCSSAKSATSLMAVASSSTKTYTFDFTDFSTLIPPVTPKETEGDFEISSSCTSMDGNIILNTSYLCLFWTATSSTALRVAVGGSLGIQAKNGYKIRKILCTGNASSLGLADGESGYMEDGSFATDESYWSNNGEDVISVTFKTGNSSAYITTMTITYEFVNSSSSNTPSGGSTKKTESAELAVYGENDNTYPAILAVKMPSVLVRSGRLIWNAGNYSKSYYTISSRELRTLGNPEYSTVSMRLAADTSLSDSDGTTISNNYVIGTSSEFRHWRLIPNSNHANAEIQCNFIANYNIDEIEENGNQDIREQTLSVDLNNYYYLKKTDGTTKTALLTSKLFRKDFADMFFIDLSIVTMHSPEIEFDTNTLSIDLSSLKLKLVGYVPITSTVSDVDVLTSSIALNYWQQSVTAPGFLHSTVGSIGKKGYRGLNTDTLWWDEEWYTKISENKERSNKELYTTAYLTYPWHRNGSMNNQPSKSYTNAEADTTEYRSAELERKVMSNLRTSFNSVYCYVDSNGNTLPIVNRLKAFNNEISNGTNLSGISLFDDDLVVNTRLQGQDDSIATINYYGNVDKLIASSRKYYLKEDTYAIGYPIFKGRRGEITAELSLSEYGEDDISIVLGRSTNEYETIEEAVLAKLLKIKNTDAYKEFEYYSFGSDPILMKYKSSPHGVLALKYIDSNTVHILPTTVKALPDSILILIVPSVRTKSNKINDEYNSYFLCPSNTIMTGRYHTGDEHGLTQYEYATLTATCSVGTVSNLTITVEDVLWSDGIEEYNSDYTAPTGRVIVGRQHSGDERGTTKYATAIIKVNGNSTTLLNEKTSSAIKENSGKWFTSDSNSVIIGRKHEKDETHNTFYTTAQVVYTALDGDVTTSSETLNKVDFSGIKPFWDENKELSVQQEVVYVTPKYGYLWMGELLNTKHSMLGGKLVDDSTPKATSVRFGGTSDSAIQNNTWLVAGDAVKLTNGVKLEWKQGDTYYLRYDCLKTYSFTTDDPNSIIDICSFMVETRVNIDGRYDRNRGQTSNLLMNPLNFNLLNTVYSQLNNYFTYKVLDENLFNTTIYKNYITWSKTKINGEEVDTWTNVTLANVLDLDGDKGTVRCLKLFNNNLLCFLDKAISQILYNELTLISTTQGVPIEIANSDKVQGKRYITTDIGSSDKWTVKNTPIGLFFMDYLHPSIYLYTGQFTNLTENLGMSTWAHNNIGYGDKEQRSFSLREHWYPYARRRTGNHKKNRCFRTQYDPDTLEVYFIGTNGQDSDINADCLVFSTLLQLFTGFQSLGDTYMIENVAGKTFLWNNESLYLQNVGTDYGNFCGNYYPYTITYIDNEDPLLDKTYTNIEFRANVDGDSGLPINILETWNEYLSGIANLSSKNGHGRSLHHLLDKTASLNRAFRIWRCDIPRDNVGVNGGKHPNDRMRNPWLYLKLTGNNKNKVEIHDLIVDHFE